MLKRLCNHAAGTTLGFGQNVFKSSNGFQTGVDAFFKHNNLPLMVVVEDSQEALRSE
jgi:hypothetical protein